MLPITTVTQKGQVTIPLPLRKKLGLTTGARVQFSDHPKEPRTILLSPVGNVFSLRGSLKSRKRFTKSAARKAYLTDVLAGKI